MGADRMKGIEDGTPGPQSWHIIQSKSARYPGTSESTYALTPPAF